VRTLADLLAEVPAMRSLPPPQREVVARCGRNRVFVPGAWIMREGDAADAFYVLRSGSAALETFSPQHGPITIETLHDGDLLGWSWLFPPHRVRFDARAIDEVHAIEFDGACLRRRCESDAETGYELMRLFAAVVVERLQGTRMRLLDVYGTRADG
jgi:CRP-like cAMP-binding protein